MANAFYVPGEQRAAKVNDLFASIARRYDLLNDLQSFGLHRRWKRRVADLADIKPGMPALDLCCGTGDISFALAARGAQVTGLDFSEPMLGVARQRNSPKSKVQSSSDVQRPMSNVQCPEGTGSNPHFIQGDAMQLPFADASFEVVTVGYGLRNLASWQRGLDEMLRVAKPGARVIVLDFGKPANPLWRKIYFTHLAIATPLMGLLFSGNAAAYAYILESLKNYPAQEGVAARMRELNLADVRVINLLGGAMAINYARKS